MRRARRALVLGGIALVGLPGAAEAAVVERLTLDAHKAVKRMPTVKSKTTLTAGTTYVVAVKGTYSEYAAPVWTKRRPCGKAERRPQYRSRGVTNGRVGSDPEFAFSLPRARNILGSDCRLVAAAPQRIGDFQVNTGVIVGNTPWVHPAILGGTPTKPTRTHRYRYAVTGQGKKVRFRIHDTQPGDNYGRLKITISTSTAAAPAPVAPAPLFG